MKPHLKYASYVIRHKWFVFLAGLKTDAPIWRLLIHDWSKLTPAEWFPYVQKFYGIGSNQAETDLGRAVLDEVQADFDKAWLHHIHHNPHHWQHHLLLQYDGEMKALRMPDDLVCEMLADWMGAGRAITGKWEVDEWYAKNKDNMKLHPDTRKHVISLILGL